MRIMIITPRLCSGGAERVSVTWANGLSKRGHEVIVIADLYSPINYHLEKGIAIHSYTKGRHRGLLKWINAVFKVRKLLKNKRPDVIIGVMSTCSLLAKLSSINMKIPIVATEHDAFERPEAGKLTWVERILKFHINRVYDKVTILTSADAEYLKSRLKNVTVLPNPLALTPIEIIPPKKQIILAMGRLDDWRYKGFDLLIKAWGELAAKHPSWNLQIAGNGTEESLKFLKSLCESYGIVNKVDFLGFREDVDKLFQDASVFVLSSRYEGFGLVLIEAMSQGCACIACDYKGRQAEIFGTDANGLICEVENTRILTEQIDYLISNKEIREQLQKNAIERSKYYGMDNVMSKWETLLTEVIAK